MRWDWLRAWIEAVWLHRGHGVGPIRGLTDEERAYAREAVQRLRRQWERADQRNRYVATLAEGDPRYAELDQKARQSEARYGELQEELQEWCEADPREWHELMSEAWNELRDRATESEP